MRKLSSTDISPLSVTVRPSVILNFSAWISPDCRRNSIRRRSACKRGHFLQRIILSRRNWHFLVLMWDTPRGRSPSHFSPSSPLFFFSAQKPDGIQWNFNGQAQNSVFWMVARLIGKVTLQGYIVSIPCAFFFGSALGAAGLETRARYETNRLWRDGDFKKKNVVIWLGGAITLKASTKPVLLLGSHKFGKQWCHLASLRDQRSTLNNSPRGSWRRSW